MLDKYTKIIETLSRCKRVLVTTHVRPDGDAIGTSAALVLAMRKAGVDAEVLLLSHLPTKYAFVFKENGIVHHDVEKGWPGEGCGFGVQGSVTDIQRDAPLSPSPGTSGEGRGEGSSSNSENVAAMQQNPHPIPLPESRARGSGASPNPEPRTLNSLFSRFDALLVADTGTWSQLPGLRERIANWNVPKLVVDHHLTQEDWADEKLVVTEAAAAGEIAAELIEQWDIPIDVGMATALYVAIASDTGWFQFSNTRPFTHRLAAMLIEKGVDTDRIYQMLHQNERAERVALQTRALQSMELLAEGRLAVMMIGKADFAETHAQVPDTENLINVPLQIRTVQVSILVTEPPDGGPMRISLRSKGQIDVARFAEQFGGGGHARASGLKIEAAFQDAHDRVVSAMLMALG